MGKLRMLKDDELMHHGVSGQKWYVRRYQNKDGSLTPLGRLHYYGSFMTREEKIKMKKEKQEAKKMKLIAKGDKKDIYRNRDLFTDDEYDEAMKRSEKFEKTKKAISADTKEKIKEFEKGVNKDLLADSKQAMKEYIYRTGNPLTIVKNASLFSDEELTQALNRLRTIDSIKGLNKDQKKQIIESSAKINNGKNVVDSINSGLQKADQLVNNANKLVIDSYQTNNKFKSIINTLNDNDDLPTYVLEPWDSLRPKNKKIKKNEFQTLLTTYGLDDSLTSDQIQDLYNKIINPS